MMDGSYSEALDGGLILRVTDRADSPLLDNFFTGYDRAFVLPDEREEIDGFRACLALNQRMPRLFGRRHSELVLTVDDSAGALLGGANFLATAMVAAGGPAVSVALNYVFVERAARGRGLSRLLIDCVGRMANLSLDGNADGPSPAIFIEQNDPLRLTDAEYAADTAHAGIDQVDRLAIWSRLGARLVDFPYVQPALSPDQDPDDGLIYAALRYPGDAIPARWFHDHLQSFFGVSVRKGAPLDDDAAATGQLEALATRDDDIALLPMDPAITALRSRRPAGANDGFRGFARALAA